jgi:hypothetical protein
MFSLASALRRFAPTILACCCLSWILVVQAAEKNSSYRAARESITAGDLGVNVNRLADDALEGREAGRRGGLAAGALVAQEFATLHLRGGASDGGYFQPFSPNFRNVLAVLAGSDPQLKDQVLVIGAHYDHVGYGTNRDSRGPIGFIHNGADDNASGTSGMLQLAKAFTLLEPPPKRSILLIAFDAEEKGLLGSKHFVAHPTIPLDHLVAMLNMDMIGRLRDEHVEVYGVRSGSGWRRLLSEQNEGSALTLDFRWTLTGEADHFSFFEHGVPVLMLHTGLHNDYHSPRDKANLINTQGMSEVVRLMFAVAYELAQCPSPPPLRRIANRETEEVRRSQLAAVPNLGERLGVSWTEDHAATTGVQLTQVFPASPADKAKLQLGDRIVQFDGRAIRCSNDLIGAVRAAESPAVAVVQRPESAEPLEIKIDLAGEPLRLGIVWRVDEAEPGTVILTYVVPGSPAADAGLRCGDRIYRIGGREFADDTEFGQMARAAAEPMELTVERDGQIHTVELHLSRQPLRRAA